MILDILTSYSLRFDYVSIRHISENPKRHISVIEIDPNSITRPADTVHCLVYGTEERWLFYCRRDSLYWSLHFDLGLRPLVDSWINVFEPV